MPNGCAVSARCLRSQIGLSRQPRPRRRRGERRRVWLPSVFCLLLLALCLTGCSSGPPAVHAPALSPEEAGRQALAEYDANKDGFLDAKELEQCPALKS